MTRPITLYHAVDSDGNKLRDPTGRVLVVREIGWCECQRQKKCEDVATNETLWFFRSSLREVKENKE